MVQRKCCSWSTQCCYPILGDLFLSLIVPSCAAGGGDGPRVAAISEERSTWSIPGKTARDVLLWATWKSSLHFEEVVLGFSGPCLSLFLSDNTVIKM